ncbi:MAG: histidine phosphatase family protein [bacterium]|nr:histidine phosphatase family protein [bacterium]
MKLILVRHAESTWNKSNRVQGIKNPKLSDKGRRQSQLLAEKFNGMRFDAVYSSHLKRAYDTAKILTNSNISTIEDLQEIKLGVWEGLTINQVRQEYKELYTQWYQKPVEVRIPGAETVLEFKDRVVGVLDGIRAKHPDEEVLVVTHGGVITLYLAHLLEMDLNRLWSISLKNAAVTIISFCENFPCVLVFNDTCHLEKDLDLVTW